MENGMEILKDEMIYRLPAGIIRFYIGEKIELCQANDAFFRMFGTESSDYKEGLFARFGATDRMLYEPYVRRCGDEKSNIYLEMKTTHKETENIIWLRMEASYVGEVDGGAMYVAALFDITKNKEVLRELEEVKDLYLKAISHTDVTIFEYLIEDDCFVFNTPEEVDGVLINKPIRKENFLARLEEQVEIHPDDLVYFYDICKGNMIVPFNARMRKSSATIGEYLPVRVYATLQNDEEGNPYRVIGTIRPADKVIRDAETKETYRRDELTGLYTRNATKQLIEEYKANSTVHSPYALLILDIKEFKKVNDTYGHMFGDNVLIQVADCIIENIHKTDIAGRLGGDEFIVFLKNVGPSAVERMCDKLCRAIGDIYAGEDLQIAVCIGAVVCKDPAVTFHDLLKTADYVLYEQIKKKKTGVKVAKEIIKNEAELMNRYTTDHNFRVAFSAKEKRLSELVFEILENARDVDRAVNAVLALVGDKKKLSRITIMRKKEDKMYVAKQWVARGQQENKNVDVAAFMEFHQKHRENLEENGMGVINSKTMEMYKEVSEESLLGGNAKSMIYCHIMQYGEEVGLIAYVDCEKEREWKDKDFKGFRTITRLIGAYLDR